MDLGAVLLQYQTDGLPHPVAYASRALLPSESNYGITDLETLAVVWALSHFHYYLYGHKVTVITLDIISASCSATCSQFILHNYFTLAFLSWSCCLVASSSSHSLSLSLVISVTD